MKNLIQSIFAKLGYRLTRLDSVWQPPYGLDTFFPLLKTLGFAPKHIIDVGANHANWTRSALRYFPDARYTLVEPQDSLQSEIAPLLAQGYKIQWINAGVADVSGTLPFHLNSRDDSSTFLPTANSTPPATSTTPSILVPVKTLDEIAASAGPPLPDMIKIDAEGFDLKALRGASSLFATTDIFLVEVCVCSHDGDNTAAAVINFMHAAGYRLIDITDLNRSPTHHVLWLAELAFLRNGSSLLDRATSYE